MKKVLQNRRIKRISKKLMLSDIICFRAKIIPQVSAIIPPSWTGIPPAFEFIPRTFTIIPRNITFNPQTTIPLQKKARPSRDDQTF